MADTDHIRCAWATTDAMIQYHDDEWGVPSRDDQHLFEMLVLEGAQAGLSWSTILNKRDAFREVSAVRRPSNGDWRVFESRFARRNSMSTSPMPTRRPTSPTARPIRASSSVVVLNRPRLETRPRTTPLATAAAAVPTSAGIFDLSTRPL